MATSTTNSNSRIFLNIFVALKEGVFMFQKNTHKKRRLTRLGSPPLHSTPYTLHRQLRCPCCLKGVEEHSTLGRIIACHLTKMVLHLYMSHHPHQSIAYYYHVKLLSYDENHAYFSTKRSLDSSSPPYLH